MKNNKCKAMLTVVGVIAAICALICGMIAFKVINKREYYADKDNYIQAAGQIHYFVEFEGDYLGFGINESAPKSCYRSCCIEGPSFALVKRRGLIENLYEGAVVEYTIAPAIFGDGYKPPIVAITVDGEEYLSFEEGYQNLLLWLQDWKHVFFHDS